MYTLRLCIFRQLHHTLASYLSVPPVVYETVLESHCRCKVDELYLIVIIHRVILPQQPTPGVSSRLIVCRWLIEWLYYIIADSCLNDRLKRISQGDSAPRCLSWQWDSSKVSAVAVVFASVGIGNSISHACLIVREMTSAICRAYACLTDESPSVRQMEEGWEDISVSELRGFVHRSVGAIAFLVAGFRLFPSTLRTYLW